MVIKAGLPAVCYLPLVFYAHTPLFLNENVHCKQQPTDPVGPFNKFLLAAPLMLVLVLGFEGTGQIKPSLISQSKRGSLNYCPQES